jgi:hypothetical protein
MGVAAGTSTAASVVGARFEGVEQLEGGEALCLQPRYHVGPCVSTIINLMNFCHKFRDER